MLEIVALFAVLCDSRMIKEHITIIKENSTPKMMLKLLSLLPVSRMGERSKTKSFWTKGDCKRCVFWNSIFLPEIHRSAYNGFCLWCKLRARCCVLSSRWQLRRTDLRKKNLRSAECAFYLGHTEALQVSLKCCSWRVNIANPSGWPRLRGLVYGFCIRTQEATAPTFNLILFPDDVLSSPRQHILFSLAPRFT